VTKHVGDDQTFEVIHNQPFPIHLWDGLSPATQYHFTVAACNRYSGECSPASPPLAGSTYDGLAGPPADVSLSCRSDNVSAMNWVDVKWTPPAVPNGRLEFYNVELTGRAKFRDENGKATVIDTSPQRKTEDAAAAAAMQQLMMQPTDNNNNNNNKNQALLTKASLQTRFDFLESNTNYSVRVCAVTGSKECGEWRQASCTMGNRPPPDAELAKFVWTPAPPATEEENPDAGITSRKSTGGPLYKLAIPKLSGRNGPVCCLRVVVVKLPTTESGSIPSPLPLPPPGSLPLTSFAAVHAAETAAGGAYIAEIVSAIYMGREVVIGDGKNTAALGLGSCPECSPPPVAAAAAREKIQKRFTGGDNSGDTLHHHHDHHHQALADAKSVEDGFLDATANYTAFVEVIVESGVGGGSSVIGRSPYMLARQAGLETNPGLKKNPAQWFFLFFFVFFCFFEVLCFFCFFCFFLYNCPEERVFMVFFSFKNTLRCIQTLNYNHSY
jgi:protein-tyrosine phosphatase